MNEQVVYYQKRAAEYELIYQKTERQADLDLVKSYLQDQFHDHSVLELACGTGYWTELLAKQARSITAIDINSEVLDIARTKNYSKGNVQFLEQDIEEAMPAEYDSIFGGFIWSHIPREELANFLKQSLGLIGEDGEMIFLDNKYVHGSSTAISRTDDRGNSYQKRQLKSGESFEVIKNFPDENEVSALAENLGISFQWIEFEYYWIAKFSSNNPAHPN